MGHRASSYWYNGPSTSSGGLSCQLLLVRRPAEPAAAVSEVEVVDVGGVEDERRAEQDGLVRADRERAELARAECLALSAVDLLRRELDRGVPGQIAEVGRVPQLEGLDGAVGDVLLQRVRSAKTGQQNLAAVLIGIQDCRG